MRSFSSGHETSWSPEATVMMKIWEESCSRERELETGKMNAWLHMLSFIILKWNSSVIQKKRTSGGEFLMLIDDSADVSCGLSFTLDSFCFVSAGFYPQCSRIELFILLSNPEVLRKWETESLLGWQIKASVIVYNRNWGCSIFDLLDYRRAFSGLNHFTSSPWNICWLKVSVGFL